MNIFKKLIERSGKMALSGLQAAGLTAVVGVAAVGVWQYLSAPADDTTAFNLNNPSNSGNVVYVAGANGGNYAGGNYGGGVNYGAGADGKGGSYRLAGSMQKLNQRQAARDQVDRMLYDEQKAQEDAEKAYAFGATEGFGSASNAANEENSENNPLAALGAMSDLANIKDAVSSQVEAGAAGRGRAASRASSGGLAQLAKASLGGGSTRAGGADINMSSGDFASARGKSAGANTSLEGRRLSGQIGGDLMGSSKFSRSQDAENNKMGLKGLELLAAKSKKIAAHDDRAANEESTVFLGGEKLSGGLLIAGENVTTGQGSASSDLSSFDSSALRGRIGAALDDLADQQENRRKDGWKLFGALLWRFLVATALIPLMAPFVHVPLVGKAVAALFQGTILLLANQMLNKVAEFRQVYGHSNWDATGNWLVGIVTALSLVAWTGTFTPSFKDNEMEYGFANYWETLQETFGIQFSKDADKANIFKNPGKEALKEIRQKMKEAVDNAQQEGGEGEN